MGDQAPELLSVVRYFTDLAFHKFLSCLEMGEGGIHFTLSLCDESCGEKHDLVNEELDRDLRGSWFDWIEKYGE